MVTQAFRLRPIMKQGTAASIPETWTHYLSVEDARAGVTAICVDNDPRETDYSAWARLARVVCGFVEGSLVALALAWTILLIESPIALTCGCYR